MTWLTQNGLRCDDKRNQGNIVKKKKKKETDLSVQRKIFLAEIQFTTKIECKESMAIMIQMTKLTMQGTRNIIAFIMS